jgi:DnaJ-class molecular chaperone
MYGKMPGGFTSENHAKVKNEIDAALAKERSRVPPGLRITLETQCEQCKGFGATRNKEKGAITIECPICKGHGSVRLQSMGLKEFCRHLEIIPYGRVADGKPYTIRWRETIP